MTFELDPTQKKKAYSWMKKLIKDNAEVGTIGGRFTFSFTGTGLGLIIKVIDNVTKQELDLTDYENW